VNKFLGDGFMAVFGAPLAGGDPREDALQAALEIVRALENATSPPTRIGIGLHAGTAVTGTVGSSTRKEYTIIGDVVNIAARIEQLNKEYGSQLLVSGAVWEVAADAVPAEALGLVTVRGHEAGVEIYRLA
jgi:adenylate cyclase